MEWLKGIAVAILLLNTAATVILFFAPGASWLQRFAQTLVIWLLPLVGALLILHLHLEFKDRGSYNLAVRFSHPYVSQPLEAEARVANHAARAEFEHVVGESLSHSDGGAADGH